MIEAALTSLALKRDLSDKVKRLGPARAPVVHMAALRRAAIELENPFFFNPFYYCH